ncbi:hypothetical protein I6N91_16810 [Arthrobacter sp. MSA 4-2]|uniref:hypothetical protein n=1 Tax=Arthrobacter sp. MSA 4-2 TaxID=2794349 RepID=UPI0018E7F335|nr:hypothetical protein [Arthrobacter sp. MSA 4-2]MBJ2122640.1 hypothetical protein [Arthrobacter sp. MSA 4-2]
MIMVLPYIAGVMKVDRWNAGYLNNQESSLLQGTAAADYGGAGAAVGPSADRFTVTGN